ncbi:MAG TPA: gliding motility-associated C-terminal domain-containing protein [Flavitalea sp.]|nr:gliding motility-associated C-terminal domain-containing protein [Flavitalea sp.]
MCKSSRILPAHPSTGPYQVSDGIVVKVQPTQALSLPNEATICKGENVKLETNTRFRSYSWSTGEFTSGISISQAGRYSVEVIDKLGCRWYDTIVVKLGECGISLTFPNAFSPNGDGRNDVFKPRMVKNIARYTLEVFNRYGQLVFKSRDTLLGWDGALMGS